MRIPTIVNSDEKSTDEETATQERKLLNKWASTYQFDDKTQIDCDFVEHLIRIDLLPALPESQRLQPIAEQLDKRQCLQTL